MMNTEGKLYSLGMARDIEEKAYRARKSVEATDIIFSFLNQVRKVLQRVTPSMRPD